MPQIYSYALYYCYSIIYIVHIGKNQQAPICKQSTHAVYLNCNIFKLNHIFQSEIYSRY